MRTVHQLTKNEVLAYQRGFKDGLECYAWRGGETMYVGTAGVRLVDAKQKLGNLWNFAPGLDKEFDK